MVERDGDAGLVHEGADEALVAGVGGQDPLEDLDLLEARDGRPS